MRSSLTSVGAGHGHGHAVGRAADRGRLRLVLAITAVVLVVELVGAFAILAPIAMSDPSPAGAAQRTSGTPAPLMWSRSFADPTVVESRVGYVGAATAPNLNIGLGPADVEVQGGGGPDVADTGLHDGRVGERARPHQGSRDPARPLGGAGR